MRRGLPALVLAAGLSAVACRDIAGIEDLAPPDGSPDGPPAHDARALDAGRSCDCPACEVLAVDLPFPVTIVRVGSDLYVANYGPDPDAGSIVRIPTRGGTVETVLPKLEHPSALIVDDDEVYWMAEDGKGHGTLSSRALAGGVTATLVGGLEPVPMIYQKKYVNIPTGALMALTATTLYFVQFSGSKTFVAPTGIRSVPKHGGMSSLLVRSNPPDAGALSPIYPFPAVLDEHSLVFTNSNGTFSGILRAPLPTGPISVVIDNLVAPTSLTVGKDTIVFITVGLHPGAGTVQSIPRSGGSPTKLMDGLDVPWVVLVDGDEVFASSIGEPSGGAILKVGIDGGKVSTLVAKAPQPAALATDSEYLYWVDPLCKTVMKIHK